MVFPTLGYHAEWGFDSKNSQFYNCLQGELLHSVW